jgi:hypothetical protein
MGQGKVNFGQGKNWDAINFSPHIAAATLWDLTNPQSWKILFNVPTKIPIRFANKSGSHHCRWNYSSRLCSQVWYTEFPVPQKCGGKAAPRTLFIVSYVVDRALATSEEGEQYPFLVYLAPSTTLFRPPVSNSECRPEVCPDHVVLVFPSRLHMVHKGCGFKSKTLYSHVLVLVIIVDNDTIPSPAVGLTVLYKNITKSRMTQSIRSDYPIHSETRTLNVWNLLQLQEDSCTWIH